MWWVNFLGIVAIGANVALLAANVALLQWARRSNRELDTALRATRNHLAHITLVDAALTEAFTDAYVWRNMPLWRNAMAEMAPGRYQFTVTAQRSEPS